MVRTLQDIITRSTRFARSVDNAEVVASIAAVVVGRSGGEETAIDKRYIKSVTEEECVTAGYPSPHIISAVEQVLTMAIAEKSPSAIR